MLSTQVSSNVQMHGERERGGTHKSAEHKTNLPLERPSALNLLAHTVETKSNRA